MPRPVRASSLIIYADGSQTPTGSGAGIVVLTPSGHIRHVENQPLPHMTNNEAEYAALTLALETARRLRADVIEIRLDSDIVVGQMTGTFAVKSARLRVCHARACDIARSFPRVRYTTIPREENALADALATEASAGRHWQMEQA